MAERFDRAELQLPRTDAWGFLHVEGIVAKPGVYKYLQKDGSYRRELKPPEELYAEAHLASVRDAVVTDEHPDGGLAVTPANAREHMKGHGTAAEERPGGLFSGVKVTDGKLISMLKSRVKSGVSLGLDVEIDPTPGFWQGEPYDVVQRKMVTNQISFTDAPRIESAHFRLDSLASDGAIMGGEPATELEPETETNMKTMKLKIGDSTVEVEPGEGSLIKAHIDGLEGKLSTSDSELKSAQKERDEARAKLDAANEDLKKKEGLTVDAKDLPKLFAARAKLLKGASSVLDEKSMAKLDDATDMDVRKAVLAEAKIDIEGETDDYIRARFDSLVEREANSKGKQFAESMANVSAASPEQLRSTDSDDSPQSRLDAVLKAQEERRKAAH